LPQTEAAQDIHHSQAESRQEPNAFAKGLFAGLDTGFHADIGS